MFTKGKWAIGAETSDRAGGKSYFIGVKETTSSWLLPNITICEFTSKFNKDDAQLIIAAVNACQKVNQDNPMAVAEGIPEMYEALGNLLGEFDRTKRNSQWRDCYANQQIRKAEAALAKVEGKIKPYEERS